MAQQNIGALVNLTPPQEGDNTWTAQQTELDRSPPDGDAPGRQSIDWSFGPIKITGYIDTETFEVVVSVTIVGVNVGNISGNTKDSIVLNVDLFTTKGEIRLYLKNGNEIWAHLDVKTTFDGGYYGDYKIITI